MKTRPLTGLVLWLKEGWAMEPAKPAGRTEKADEEARVDARSTAREPLRNIVDKLEVLLDGIF
jgi:hypothetical protein